MDEQGKTPEPQTFETQTPPPWEAQTPPTSEAQTPPSGAARPRADLRQELRELADTLEQAVRGLTSSERTREIEQEVRTGFSTLRQQAETALQEAKLPEAAQEFGAQAKRVAQEAVRHQTAQQTLATIARGLQALNQQLERLIVANKPQGAQPEGGMVEGDEVTEADMRMMPDVESPPVDQELRKINDGVEPGES